MKYRKTLQRDLSFEGIGLHTSNHSVVRITPAPDGTGIVFVVRGESIQVDHNSLNGSALGTNIVNGNCQTRTVEHLLSALCACGITDAFVVTDATEIPILDGSAIDFFNGIAAVGTKKLSAFEPIAVRESITVFDGEKYIALEPIETNEIIIEFEIKFDNEAVSKMPQNLIYRHNTSNFYDHIASARTFGFKKDLEHLLSLNLCLGGSLENAILIDENRIINVNGLRFENELVAHKILDLVGDLSPILSKYTGFKIKAHQAGHSINNKFLRKFCLAMIDIELDTKQQL